MFSQKQRMKTRAENMRKEVKQTNKKNFLDSD